MTELTANSMFFQLLFIHLFRPFLKYTQATSPLPQNVSPRKLCTQAAGMISKLMRLYKRSHGLRQICNIAVYIVHSACTIHLLNLPDKSARRDIVHGVKHLEEIAEGWLCARRTLGILSVIVRKWKIELPEEAACVLARTDNKFGQYVSEMQSPAETRRASIAMINPPQYAPQNWYNPVTMQAASGHLSNGVQPASGTDSMVRYDDMLPPHEPISLHVQQYSSPTPTPTTASVQIQQKHHGSISGEKQGHSPSEMFGGVEQLMRDSRDWVMRDQAQFAMGFENWTTTPALDSVDLGAWANGDSGLLSGGSSIHGNNNSNSNNNNNAAAAAMPASLVQRNPSISSANGTMSAPTAVTNNGYPSAEWLAQMNGGLTVYNEDDWYQ